MNIVLEGADGVGKSTIAEVLAKDLGYKLRGRIVRVGPDKVMEAHSRDIRRQGDWVLDRCYWLSDFIYEPIYNGTPSVFNSSMIYEMKDINTVIVHVTCSEKVLRNRFDMRGDEIYNKEQILLAHNRYKDFFSKYNVPFIEVDTTTGSVKEHVQEIINKLGEM